MLGMVEKRDQIGHFSLIKYDLKKQMYFSETIRVMAGTSSRTILTLNLSLAFVNLLIFYNFYGKRYFNFISLFQALCQC